MNPKIWLILFVVAKYHPGRISRVTPTAPELASAERKLWGELRVLRDDGLNFRRRALIDGHTVDFICQKAAVVVQLEDPVTNNAGYDATLHRLITNRGFALIRVKSEDVESDLQAVCESVLDTCAERCLA